MSTCVVTGGAGFLGSHLCELLLERGHRVICIDNLETGSLQNIAHIRDGSFEFRHVDIIEYVDIAEDVDFVYHLASPASPIDYLRLPLHTLKVGSHGTHHMLGVAKFKRARFLLASTSEVYGDPQVHPQREDYWGHVNPIGPRGVYDEAKRYAEAMTMAYHRQQGVDTSIVRIFNTYGPRMRAHDGRAIPTFLRQALQDRPLTVFGDGSQTRSFCYVDDLIRGIVALAESDAHLPVNVGNPNEFTLLELAKAVIEVTESRSEIIFEPLPVDDPQQRQPDISRARDLLGWEPEVDLREGLRRTIDQAGIEQPRRRLGLSAAPQYPPVTMAGNADKTAAERLSIAPVVGPDDERVFTDSGIEIDPLYTEGDVAPGLKERLGAPGAPPFTRGIHERMYRDRLWTMRQYAGFATPEDTNERYRYLIEHGSTGLSMAFDLPTQLGRDSDDPLCRGEVGRTGVPIDTIEDMRICFDRIPLDGVSTSMTINAPAAILLLLYELVGEEQGVPSEKLRGTVQNDVLKEYMARGNYIYPPEPTMRLTTDIFEYCHESVPKWNTISISGYHIREKGCSAVQEVAFTLSNAIAYVEAALERGLKIDEFAPRLAFFFNCHNNVFQEVAKFRAVRRMWAKTVEERFGAKNPNSMKIRFHTQTGGVTLQAQQPEVNIIRVALQGFAAVAGGTQSLHTNGFDEALALPTERSARIALRTQQVLAHESGVADTVDPFAGSYFVESLTDEIESRAL